MEQTVKSDNLGDEILRERSNKTNAEEGCSKQLHILSVEELIAAEVVVIKGLIHELNPKKMSICLRRVENIV